MAFLVGSEEGHSIRDFVPPRMGSRGYDAPHPEHQNRGHCVEASIVCREKLQMSCGRCSRTPESNAAMELLGTLSIPSSTRCAATAKSSGFRRRTGSLCDSDLALCCSTPICLKISGTLKDQGSLHAGSLFRSEDSGWFIAKGGSPSKSKGQDSK